MLVMLCYVVSCASFVIWNARMLKLNISNSKYLTLQNAERTCSSNGSKSPKLFDITFEKVSVLKPKFNISNESRQCNCFDIHVFSGWFVGSASAGNYFRLYCLSCRANPVK